MRSGQRTGFITASGDGGTVEDHATNDTVGRGSCGNGFQITSMTSLAQHRRQDTDDRGRSGRLTSHQRWVLPNSRNPKLTTPMPSTDQLRLVHRNQRPVEHQLDAPSPSAIVVRG